MRNSEGVMRYDDWHRQRERGIFAYPLLKEVLDKARCPTELKSIQRKARPLPTEDPVQSKNVGHFAKKLRISRL